MIEAWHFPKALIASYFSIVRAHHISSAYQITSHLSIINTVEERPREEILKAHCSCMLAWIKLPLPNLNLSSYKWQTGFRLATQGKLCQQLWWRKGNCWARKSSEEYSRQTVSDTQRSTETCVSGAGKIFDFRGPCTWKVYFCIVCQSLDLLRMANWFYCRIEEKLPTCICLMHNPVLT